MVRLSGLLEEWESTVSTDRLTYRWPSSKLPVGAHWQLVLFMGVQNMDDTDEDLRRLAYVELNLRDYPEADPDVAILKFEEELARFENYMRRFAEVHRHG